MRWVFYSRWSNPCVQTTKLILEMSEVVILLIYSLFYFNLQQIGRCVDFIVNALGLVFIAEVDEMIVSFISKSQRDFILLHMQNII